MQTAKTEEGLEEARLTRAVAALMPSSEAPEREFPKLKMLAADIFLKVGKVGEYDKTHEAVRNRQDSQRYYRTVIRAQHFLNKQEGQLWLVQGAKQDQLEVLLRQHFTRNKWVIGDLKKTVSQILSLVNSSVIRRSSPLPNSSGLNWRGPEKERLSLTNQQILRARCNSQDWPGICYTTFPVFGRGKHVFFIFSSH